MRIKFLNSRLHTVGTLNKNAALGLGKPSLKDITLHYWSRKRAILRTEFEGLFSYIQNAATRIESNRPVDIDHLSVYDEDSCVRLGECKDIHADFALENVLIDILVGNGLSCWRDERNLRHFISRNDDT